MRKLNAGPTWGMSFGFPMAVHPQMYITTFENKRINDTLRVTRVTKE